MVNQEKFIEVGGLDEENLSIAFNDVDFCLRLMECGYQNIFTPYAEAYHHESLTRGYEDNEEKKKRFQSEVMHMKKRHHRVLEKGDSCYNKNLTLEREDFSLSVR